MHNATTISCKMSTEGWKDHTRTTTHKLKAYKIEQINQSVTVHNHLRTKKANTEPC